MKERPILFSGEMVRAILEGRKTQTRRVVVPQPHNPETFGISPVWGYGVHKEGASLPGAKPGRFCLHAAFDVGGKRVDRFVPCPFGEPGGRLWVRETLRMYDDSAWYYDADQGPIELDEDHPSVPAMVSWAHHNERDFCPSIHMPRWASRITLEITGVRVERVQDIGGQDAIAEGVERDGGYYVGGPHPKVEGRRKVFTMAWQAYKDIWNHLNAKRGYGWDTNPWVWVIEFRRVDAQLAAA